MPENLENSAMATGLEKASFHSNPKGCSNYLTIALISHVSKVMLKILPLEKEMAIHSSILAWRIPWTEESGGL